MNKTPNAELLAAVEALIPMGIENFTPSCTVCREPLPSNRRSIGHHAGACHRVTVMHRRYMLSRGKCPSCLHPSTPEQRVDFKTWRRHRGDVREKEGNPHRTKKVLDNPAAHSIACQ